MSDETIKNETFDYLFLNAIKIQINEKLPPDSFMLMGKGTAAIFFQGKTRYVKWDTLTTRGDEIEIIGLREVSKDK